VAALNCMVTLVAVWAMAALVPPRDFGSNREHRRVVCQTLKWALAELLF
jgi:hypothetical protein